MTPFDYGAVFLVAVSSLGGIVKGFTRSVISTVAIIAGFFFAAYAYRSAALLIRPAVESDTTATVLGFALVYALTIAAGFLVSRAFRQSLKKARLGWLDHLMGGAFGLLRGWFFCSVVYITMMIFPVKIESVQPEVTTPYLARGAKIITGFASKYIRSPFLQQAEPAPGPQEKLSGGVV